MKCKDSAGQDLVPGDIVCSSASGSKNVLLYIYVGKKRMYKCMPFHTTINKPFFRYKETVVKVNIEELKKSDKQYVIKLLKLREEKYGNSRY